MAVEQNKKDKDATLATGTSGIAGMDDKTSNQSATSGSTPSSSGTDYSMGGGSPATGSTSSTGGGLSTTGGGSATGGQGSTGAQGGQTDTSADQVASTVGSVLRGDTGAATGAARGIVSQVKETGGKVASEALGTVKEKATSKIDEQRTHLAQGLGSVADTIRQVGETLKESGGDNQIASLTAQYGDTLARQVEQFSGYLDKHNVSDLMRDVESFARRNPAYFIGGAFLLGLLGARFLKSTSPNQALTRYEGGNTGTGRREIFHHHTGNEPIDKGIDLSSNSGEGIRPV
jgi:hypothetical protein